MIQLGNLTGSSKQSFFVTTEAGDSIEFYIYYSPTQECWNYSFAFGDFRAEGMRLVTGVNIIRRFKELVPFGIACGSSDGLEPSYLTDFASGRITLFLLNPAEVELYEASLGL